MIKTVEKEFNEKLEEDHKIPLVIKWKGVDIIRSQSFRATIKEIVEVIKTLDVVNIGIVGTQNTGKSTLAESIAHMVHKLSEFPFSVRVFDREALLSFETTLSGLEPANYVLVFDDVSFLGAQASKKQVDLIKQAVTVIRHLPGGQDVKIVIIMNYHYTKGLDKYLRQAHFFYFTSVGSSELSNMEEIVGHENMQRVIGFQKLYTRMLVSKVFEFRIAPKPKPPFRYKLRDPFIPVLFWNNNTLRIIVSPKRQWVDQLCSICENAKKDVITELNLGKFLKETEGKFNEQIVKAAVKQILLINGMNVYSKPVKRCVIYLYRALEAKIFKIEDFASHYGMTVDRVRLDAKLDGEMARNNTVTE